MAAANWANKSTARSTGSGSSSSVTEDDDCRASAADGVSSVAVSVDSGWQSAQIVVRATAVQRRRLL